jgi:hypothetical protein
MLSPVQEKKGRHLLLHVSSVAVIVVIVVALHIDQFSPFSAPLAKSRT